MCAARGSNSVPPIKSRVHHLSCLQRWSRRRWSRRQESNPHHLLGRQRSWPLGDDGTVAPAGNDPASQAFQASADPSQLESHGRGGQIRTGALVLPGHAGWPSFPTPQSGYQESDLEPLRPQRSALPLSYIPWSGWQESDLLPPGPGPGALPMSYNPKVEEVGIEPPRLLVDHRGLEPRASCLQNWCSAR